MGNKEEKFEVNNVEEVEELSVEKNYGELLLDALQDPFGEKRIADMMDPNDSVWENIKKLFKNNNKSSNFNDPEMGE